MNSIIRASSHLGARADTCAAYTGGYCSSYVTYPFLLAADNTQAKNEALLKAGGMDLLITLNASTPSYRPCISTFLEWTCYSFYPSCHEGKLDQVTCKSVCDEAVAQCTSLFAVFGQSASLPDCTKPIQTWNVSYSSSETCLGRASSFPKTEEKRPAPLPLKCPSFLIKSPLYNDSEPARVLPHVLGQTCSGPCCVPCPLIHQFYDKEKNDAIDTATMVVSVLSAVLSGFMIISFITFPKRRVYPQSLLFLFTLSAFGMHAAQLAALGNPTRVTCVDPITEARQQNSSACALEGFLLIACVFGLTVWITIYMLNFHLTIVWRNDFMHRHAIVANVIGAVLCLIPPILFAASNGISSMGTTCMFDSDHAVSLFFVPVGVVGIPATLLTLFTVLYLWRLLQSMPDSKRVSRRKEPGLANSSAKLPMVSVASSGAFVASTVIGSSARDVDNNAQGDLNGENSLASGASVFRKSNLALHLAVTRDAEKALHAVKEHREKMRDVFRKSWRSIAICVSFIVIFGTFWGFYFRFTLVMSGVSTSTEWVQAWFGCVMQGKSRNECALIASPYVPSMAGIAAAQILSAIIGTVITLIFGEGMVEEWRDLVKGKERLVSY